MRSPRVFLALLAPPAVGAGVVLACGGPSFTVAPSDGGATPGEPPDAPSAEAGGTSFCFLEAGTHTFCDDFDGPPLSAKWDSIDTGGGGTAVTDSTTSYSLPRSFKSIAPASVGAETRGRVVKSFGTASQVVVAFEMLLDSAPPKLAAGAVGGDSLVGIGVGPSYSIGIDAHSDQIGYFEDTGDGGTTEVLSGKNLVATNTLSGWTEFVLSVDLANATLSIAIGGSTIVNGAPITPPAGETIAVDVGAYSRDQTSSLAAHFDNVTMDITP